MNTPSKTTDEAIRRIISKQGWDDATLRLLAFQWIENAGLLSQFLRHLKEIAEAENCTD